MLVKLNPISGRGWRIAVDYTPYEGMRVTGWPETTISRSDIVWHEGEVLAAPGRGRFLPCARRADSPALP